MKLSHIILCLPLLSQSFLYASLKQQLNNPELTSAIKSLDTIFEHLSYMINPPTEESKDILVKKTSCEPSKNLLYELQTQEILILRSKMVSKEKTLKLLNQEIEVLKKKKGNLEQQTTYGEKLISPLTHELKKTSTISTSTNQPTKNLPEKSSKNFTTTKSKNRPLKKPHPVIHKPMDEIGLREMIAEIQKSESKCAGSEILEVKKYLCQKYTTKLSNLYKTLHKECTINNVEFISGKYPNGCAYVFDQKHGDFWIGKIKDISSYNSLFLTVSSSLITPILKSADFKLGMQTLIKQIKTEQSFQCTQQEMQEAKKGLYKGCFPERDVTDPKNEPDLLVLLKKHCSETNNAYWLKRLENKFSYVFDAEKNELLIGKATIISDTSESTDDETYNEFAYLTKREINSLS